MHDQPECYPVLPMSGRSFLYQQGYGEKKDGEYVTTYKNEAHHMVAGELLALEWLAARLGRIPNLPPEDEERLSHLSVFDCAIIGRNMPGYPPDVRDRECSHICFPQIIIGIYQDEDRRLASFFFAVGCTLPARIDRTQPDTTWQMQLARHAWEDGFAFATRAGVTFPPAVHQWAEDCIETYRGHK